MSEKNKIYYYRIQKNQGKNKKIIFVGQGNEKQIKNLLKNMNGSFTIWKKLPNETKFKAETIYLNNNNSLGEENMEEEKLKIVEYLIKLEYSIKNIETKLEKIIGILEEESKDEEENINKVMNVLSNSDKDNQLKSLLDLLKK